MSVPCAICGTPVTRPAWRLRQRPTATCGAEPCVNVVRRRAVLRSDRRIDTHEGVVLVRVGHGHLLADGRGFAREHRLVLSLKLGRWLHPFERVAWINGDRTDNRPENLVLVSSPRGHMADDIGRVT